MRFFVYKDTVKEWRWRLIAANGKIVAISGESYHNRKDALDMIYKIQSVCAENKAAIEIEDK